MSRPSDAFSPRANSLARNSLSGIMVETNATPPTGFRLPTVTVNRFFSPHSLVGLHRTRRTTEEGAEESSPAEESPSTEQSPRAVVIRRALDSFEPRGITEDPSPLTGATIREIGSQAVWSLSSCKPGFGVEQLRDNCLETYWQSDGPQPHLVNVQFRRKTTVIAIAIYADFKLDESYTPNRISIRVGNHYHDIHEIEQIELNEPTGWIIIPLLDSSEKPIRAFLIQIAIMSNHQNGRDTHIRQIRIHSPLAESILSPLNIPTRFVTTEFSKYVNIR